MLIESTFTGILGIVIALLLSLYVYFTWNFNYWKKRHVSGPSPRPYVGTYPKSSTFQKNTNFLLEADEIYRKYCRKHRFVGTFEFGQPVLLILDPALAKEVYVNSFKQFSYNAVAYTINAKTDPLFVGNPFIKKDDLWKESRSEISPALTMQKIKPMYPIVTEICEKMVKYVDEKIESGENTFISKELAERFTAETICNCGYGLDGNAFGDHSEFWNEAKKSLDQTSWSMYHNLLLNIFPFLRIFFPTRWMSKESNDWFINLMNHAIDMRKQSGMQRDDYLNSMLELQAKKNLPNIEIATHNYTLFLNGYETSSHFLAGGLNELARHPDIQQRLRDEILSYDKIEFDDLHQMPYLDLVFNEALRCSPFPFPLWKMCTENTQLTDYDGTTVKIEKGTRIFIPTYSIHHHPEFYSEPNVFKPDRFDESKGHGLKYYKDAGLFMPFGNGPRICLGMRLAVVQIKSALCELIRNFEVQRVSNEDDIPSGMFFFTDAGTKLRFRRV